MVCSNCGCVVKLLESIAQLISRDPEQFGGARLIAVAALECLSHQRHFDIVEHDAFGRESKHVRHIDVTGDTLRGVFGTAGAIAATIAASTTTTPRASANRPSSMKRPASSRKMLMSVFMEGLLVPAAAPAWRRRAPR